MPQNPGSGPGYIAPVGTLDPEQSKSTPESGLPPVFADPSVDKTFAFVGYPFDPINRNLIVWSDDTTMAAWSSTNVTLTASQSDPLGGTDAWKIDHTASSVTRVDQIVRQRSELAVRLQVMAGGAAAADDDCSFAIWDATGAAGVSASSFKILRGPGAISHSSGMIDIAGLSETIWTEVEFIVDTSAIAVTSDVQLRLFAGDSAATSGTNIYFRPQVQYALAAYDDPRTGYYQIQSSDQRKTEAFNGPDGALGQEIPVLLSNSGFTGKAADDYPFKHALFRNGLIDPFSMSVELLGQGFDGGVASTNPGSIEIANPSGDLDWLMDLSWSNRRVEVWQGKDTDGFTADFGQVLAGTAESLSWNEGTISLSIHDDMFKLNKVAQQEFYGGFDTCIRTDATSDHAHSSSNDGESHPGTFITRGMTFECRLRLPSTLPSSAFIVDREGTAAGTEHNRNYRLAIGDTSNDFVYTHEYGATPTVVTMTSASSLWPEDWKTDNKFHYCAFTRRIFYVEDTDEVVSGVVYLYIEDPDDPLGDLQEVELGTFTASEIPTGGSAGVFALGSDTALTGNELGGDMDEVRLWNRALSKEELEAGRFTTVTSSQFDDDQDVFGQDSSRFRYWDQSNQADPKTASGLVGYWRFDEGLGTVAYEETSLLPERYAEGRAWYFEGSSTTARIDSATSPGTDLDFSGEGTLEVVLCQSAIESGFAQSLVEFGNGVAIEFDSSDDLIFKKWNGSTYDSTKVAAAGSTRDSTLGRDGEGQGFLYVSASYEDSGEKFDSYLNGRSVFSSVSSALTGLWAMETHADAADISVGGGDNFYVSEIRLWSKKLSDPTVEEWYNIELNSEHPNWNDLVCWYRFDSQRGDEPEGDRPAERIIVQRKRGNTNEGRRIGSSTDHTDDTSSYIIIGKTGDKEGSSLYVGSQYRFNLVRFNIGTAGVGTYTVLDKYWDGVNWSNLETTTDNTNNFKTSGANDWSWSTTPTDWVKRTVAEVGPLYWARFERQAGTVTTAPQMTTPSYIRTQFLVKNFAAADLAGPGSNVADLTISTGTIFESRPDLTIGAAASFVGTGEGGLELAGVPKPVFIGRGSHIPLAPVNNRFLIYQPSIGPLKEIEAVYEGGRKLRGGELVEGEDIFDYDFNNAVTKFWTVDGSVPTWVNDTTDINSKTTLNSTDAALLANLTTWDSQDCAYLGYSSPFRGIEMHFTRPWEQNTAYEGKISWEYWNGEAWFPLPDVWDSTHHFTTIGEIDPITGEPRFVVADGDDPDMTWTPMNRITWTIPTDWEANQVNTDSNDHYYVRWRVESPPVSITGDSMNEPACGWAEIIGPDYVSDRRRGFIKLASAPSYPPTCDLKGYIAYVDNEQSIDKVWHKDVTPTWTDETTDAGDYGTGDVTLPDATTDEIYFGHASRFSSLRMMIGTAADHVAGAELEWHYSDGASGWIKFFPEHDRPAIELSKTIKRQAELQGDLERKSVLFLGPPDVDYDPAWGFSGVNAWSWSPPTDWETDTVNGTADKYWIRARPVVAVTGSPLADWVFIESDKEWSADVNQVIRTLAIPLGGLDPTTGLLTGDSIGTFSWKSQSIKGSHADEDVAPIYGWDEPAEVGVYLPTQPVSLADAMSEAAKSVLAYVYMTDNGRLSIYKLDDPDSPTLPATLSLNENDYVIDSLEREPTELPAWRQRVGYRPYFQGFDDGSIAPSVQDSDDRSDLRQKWRTVTGTNETVKKSWLNSRDITVQTSLYNKEDADRILKRRVRLFGVQRHFYRMTIPSGRKALTLPEGGTLTIPRFGMDNGKGFVLLSIARNTVDDSVDILLWS